MQLIINTAEPVSPLDTEILTTVLKQADADVVPAPKPAATPAPKPKPEPKPAPKPKPEPEPEPEPAAEEEDDDILGGDSSDETVSLDDVVKYATNLVSQGKTPVVRKALQDMGLKRVGDVTDANAAEFYGKIKQA